MKTEASIEIKRPIEEVFQYTLNHVAEWSLTVVENTVVEDVNGGDIGTTFHCVTEEQGNRLEFVGTVIDHKPWTLSTVHLAGPIFSIVIDYHFTDLGGKTRVTQTAELTSKGLLKFILKLLGWATQKAAVQKRKNELLNLKRLMEQ